MTESQMQTFFRDYISDNPPSLPEVYELKICKERSLAFNAVKPHQEASLKMATSGLFYKITDPPIFYGGQMRFNVPRPFDCIYFTEIKGFVVVWFYKPREKKVFIKIPIDKFIELRRSITRKSMTEEMALSIGTPLYL